METFFRDIHPHLPPYFLISGSGDSTVPLLYERYLEETPRKLLHWFGQNGDCPSTQPGCSHFTTIPIGLNCHEMADSIDLILHTRDGGVRLRESQQQKPVGLTPTTRRPFPIPISQFVWWSNSTQFSSSKLLLASFSTTTNPRSREPAWNLACGKLNPAQSNLQVDPDYERRMEAQHLQHRKRDTQTQDERSSMGMGSSVSSPAHARISGSASDSPRMSVATDSFTLPASSGLSSGWPFAVCRGKDFGVGTHYVQTMPVMHQTNMLYRFQLSPIGRGLDCHRLWEALYLGLVPITTHTPIDSLMEELPVLIVDDFHQVTEEFLREQWEVMQQRYGGRPLRKLHFSYWKEMILNTIARELSGYMGVNVTEDHIKNKERRACWGRGTHD